jgi:small subunit ribosomal protein S21
MIIVPLKEGENIERALKKFKRKFEKTGTVKELREMQAFSKPSVKRRQTVKRAIYIQKLQEKEQYFIPFSSNLESLSIFYFDFLVIK